MSDRTAEQEVFAADRAFAHEVAAAETRDRAAVWAGWFAPEGRQVVSRAVLVGPRAVRDMMAPSFDSPDFSLTWDPDQGGISDDGTMGWTSGRYTQRRAGPDPDADPVMAHGRYVTVWGRQADGSWKVSLDTGIPD